VIYDFNCSLRGLKVVLVMRSCRKNVGSIVVESSYGCPSCS
jgi:hypothetical protein